MIAAETEAEAKQIHSQEDLQLALMKIIGPRGSVFIHRDLRCVFNGNDFNNTEQWSIYARRDSQEGGQIVIVIDQLPDAQTAYNEVARQFKKLDEAGIGKEQ